MIDFSWILFVGTNFLHFKEKEVGHMTLKKWSRLFEHYKKFYNFEKKDGLFALEEDRGISEEWIKD